MVNEMKFVKATNKDVCGTCLQAYLQISYADLVRIFGRQHSKGDGYKTDAEWRFKFADGTIATIYNYKDGRSYLGRKGLAVKNIANWHVGGNDLRAVDALEAVIAERNANADRLWLSNKWVAPRAA